MTKAFKRIATMTRQYYFQLFITICFLAVFSSSIVAEIIAEDSFEDYSVGNISGNNSGSGWSGSWSTGSSSNQAKVIDTSASPLEYTDSNGNKISGGSRAIEITKNNNDVATRDLSASYNNTEIYASMMVRFTGSQGNNDFVANWLASSNTNNPNFGIKMNGGSGGADFFTRTKLRKEVYSTNIVAGQTYFLVMKLWKTGDASTKYNNAQLWVNPSTLDAEPSASSGISSSASNLQSFSKIGFRAANIDSNDSIIIDEIRYGTSWEDVTSSQSQTGNLIVNGSFELPAINNNSYRISNILDGWQLDSQGIEIRRNLIGSAFEGNQFVELDVSSNATISQTISTVANNNYQLSFVYSPRIGQPASTNNIQVYWNGVLLDDITGDGGSSHNWQAFTYTVQATGSDQLQFKAAGKSDTRGGSLDNVSLTASSAEQEQPCNSTLPTDYAIYANNGLIINNSLNINGISKGYTNVSPKVSVALDGTITTNSNLTLPALTPTSFPTNSSNTSIAQSSDIVINSASEVFYNSVIQNGKNRNITLSGGGPIHIKQLTLNNKNATLNLAAGTYYIDKLVLNGKNNKIVVNGSPVNLHIGTNFTLNNKNQNVNNAGSVEDLIVYLHSSATFTSNSDNSVFTGFIYGPEAGDITINPKKMTLNGAMISGQGKVVINSSPLTMKYTSSNQSVLTVCDNTSTLDHFTLSYSSNGLSCLPSTLSLKACENSDCSALYTQAVDVSLSGAGTWSTNPVSLTSGETTDLTFQALSAGDTALSISTSSVTPANGLKCYEDGVLDADCTINFSDAGFVFDVPTLTACKTSPDVTIRAVQIDNQTKQCIGALTGTQPVNFFSSYSSPNTGTQKVSISGTEIDTATPGTAVNLSFNADGEAIFTAQYADAGEVRLDAEFDNGNGLTLSGNDSFVAKPDALYVYTDETNAACNSGDANCSLFKQAGESFNLKVNAACWQSDTDNDYSDNPKTPNFELASIAVNSSIVAPAAGNNAILSETSFDFTTSDAGTHTVSQSVSEVGVYTFTVAPPSYFGENINVQSSDNIGRFYPAYLAVTAQDNGAFGSHACNSFTYTGQTFTYQTAPQLTVSAYNSNGVITQNYTGDFAKLSASDFDVTAPNSDAAQLGADNTNLVSLFWLKDSETLTDNSDGSHSYRFGDDRYQYAKTTNNQVAPFTNAVDLIFTAITDSDGVQTQSVPVTLQPSGENIRFGRIAVNNAYGSELSPLPVGLQAEYFDGFNWVTNTADTCSSLALATHFRLQNAATNSGVLQSGNANMIIENGTTNISNFSFANGEGSLTFSAPGEDNQGYVDIQTNLTGSYDWLLDDKDNDGSFDDEASGKASFGIFKGSDRIIFRREVY